MTVSAFDSKIYGGLLSDPEMTPLFSDDAVINSMIEVEVALAKAQGTLGIIPEAAARKIVKACSSFQPDLDDIAKSTETSGVPTIPLVSQMRRAAGDAGDYVHWGATSQDIIDTGLVLRLRKALVLIDGRLERVCKTLARLADEHRQTVMLGRTRYQQAIPTTFGLKAAVWLDGLVNARDGLQAASSKIAQLQFGGAVGTLSALKGRGVELAEALAAELDLNAPAVPWHTNRTSLVTLANEVALVTGSLGKLGQDIVLLSQTEVGEVQVSGGGGSSTMPHKANPISAETLISLSRMNAGLIGNMHQAMVQEHERGGSGWQLEVMTLPQMMIACGAALRHTEKILDGLHVNTSKMTDNLTATNGLVMAEAAVFTLADHMAASEARNIVKTAVNQMMKSDTSLSKALSALAPVDIDWAEVLKPAGYLGSSDEFIDRVLKRF